MISLAFVGSHYRSQVETNAGALSGIRVAGFGESLSDIAPQRVQVVVCDLRDLGASPQSALRAILERPGLELIVLTYSFAPRSAIDALRQDPRVRIVQGPLSLANLRAQMVHLIVRDILEQDERSSAPPTTARCPHCGEALAC